jgi:hypothetical protein
LAFARNPSYLKRQKEQQRAAKAAQKREARLARKHSKTSTAPEEMEPLDGPLTGMDGEGDDAGLDDAAPDDGTEEAE